MSIHPAARVTDVFGHDLKWQSIAAGVAVGALLAGGIIATGGLGAIAIGAALATTGSAALAGAAIGKRMDGPVTGQLKTGSINVFINGLPATMVELATGDCYNDAGSPRRVATGSASVFINGRPVARVTETMDCGAVIRTGSPNIFIGGPKQSPVCTALRGEEATFERFRIAAEAASAVYDPPETRKPLEGYRNATAEDLRKLRLSEGMLEHPVNPKTKQPPIFVRPSSYIIRPAQPSSHIKARRAVRIGQRTSIKVWGTKHSIMTERRRSQRTLLKPRRVKALT